MQQSPNLYSVISLYVALEIWLLEHLFLVLPGCCTRQLLIHNLNILWYYITTILLFTYVKYDTLTVMQIII